MSGTKNRKNEIKNLKKMGTGEKYDEKFMNKVTKCTDDWVNRMVDDYVSWILEGWYECDGNGDITFDNLEEFKKYAWANINYINDCAESFESLYECLEKSYNWEEGEFDEFWEKYENDLCPDIGTYVHIDYGCDGFYGIQAKVWDSVDEIAEKAARENEIAKAKKFSKDDVMKFLEETIVAYGFGYDEETDLRTLMWYRKAFKGNYDRCDIAFVSSCDLRMEKIGKIVIDEDCEVLIDLVSADKMDDVNVDADVVELINQIAA